MRIDLALRGLRNRRRHRGHAVPGDLPDHLHKDLGIALLARRRVGPCRLAPRHDLNGADR